MTSRRGFLGLLATAAVAAATGRVDPAGGTFPDPMANMPGVGGSEAWAEFMNTPTTGDHSTTYVCSVEIRSLSPEYKKWHQNNMNTNLPAVDPLIWQSLVACKKVNDVWQGTGWSARMYSIGSQTVWPVRSYTGALTSKLVMYFIAEHQ